MWCQVIDEIIKKEASANSTEGDKSPKSMYTNAATNMHTLENQNKENQ